MKLNRIKNTSFIFAFYTIWHRHMRKFLGNGEELFGLMIQPLLWVFLFGIGMKGLVNDTSSGIVVNYIAFILPGIIALSLMGGAIGGGMVWLDERKCGIVKGYLVAPIPRMSIIFANIGSTLSKSLFQAAIIFAVGVLLGIALHPNPLSWSLSLSLIIIYALGFSGLALAIASLTDDLMAYHAMIMLLNLPVLFLSNALYPLESLPKWIQYGAMLNPTSYMIDGVRQTILIGNTELAANGFIPLWICFLVMSGFSAVGILAAFQALKKKTAQN